MARVQAIITTTDPIVSIGLSILLLDVRLRGGAAAITLEVVSLLVMVAGVVVIASIRRRPKVRPPQRRPSSKQPLSEPGGRVFTRL